MDITQLQPFGCHIWFKKPDTNCNNLDSKDNLGLLLSAILGGIRYTLTPAPSPYPPSTSPTPSTRQSTRVRNAPDLLGIWEKPTGTVPGAVETPKAWQKLMWSSNIEKWIKAADARLYLLPGMKTWSLVACLEKQKQVKICF